MEFFILHCSAYNLFFKQERERMLNIATDDNNNNNNKTSSEETGNNKEGSSMEIVGDGSSTANNTTRKHSKSSGIGFANLARIVASKWKDLEPALKEPFETIANKEKERYKEEMVEWRALQKKKHLKPAGDDSSWKPTFRSFNGPYAAHPTMGRHPPSTTHGEWIEGRGPGDELELKKHRDSIKQSAVEIFSGPRVSSPKRHSAPPDPYPYARHDKQFYSHDAYTVTYFPARSDYYDGRGPPYPYYSYEPPYPRSQPVSPNRRPTSQSKSSEDTPPAYYRPRSYTVPSRHPDIEHRPPTDEAYARANCHHSQIHNSPYGQDHTVISYPYPAGHPMRPPVAYPYPPPGPHDYHHYHYRPQVAYEEETLRAPRGKFPQDESSDVEEDNNDNNKDAGEKEQNPKHQPPSSKKKPETKTSDKSSDKTPTATSSGDSHEECSLLENSFENIDTNLDTDTVDYLTTLQFD